MATSVGSSTYNMQNWEHAHFPILHQTCLGENPYTSSRMTKEKYSKECKICARPFSVLLVPRRYGLPVRVRDAGLSSKDDMPKSDVNRVLHTEYGEGDV
ncbi:hypothetical protein QTO34_002153 [Cnephaeus nilssonii]|uniref:Uncharacterized protein n=1 Tax=Cnephaeus nilssonii TaxID=3371016 RepID=A0AA40HUG4_CNENI|nr:hypothetical protein QTO34_002153 [Eptesicus nilssonii]